MLIRFLLFLLSLFSSSLSQAHKSSDSYLTLKVADTRIEVRWDIALRDLDYAIGLDSDENSEITWGEVRSMREAVIGYALSRLKLAGDGQSCPLTAGDYLIDTHTDGSYSVLILTAKCNHQPSAVNVDYSLLFDLDPQHRGLLRVENGQTANTAVLSPANHRQLIELADIRAGPAFLQYLKEGIWHIWLGYDHILFLLSLLFPAVLIRQNMSWQPAVKFQSVLIDVVKIVTAFTLAHSLTLSLAVLGLIHLPSRWVESAIAASVIMAALNNIYPVISKRLWLMAFCFGLIHGLGFANVLNDLGLPNQLLLPSLLAFNIGVEIGQLVVVSLFLPAAYRMRHSVFYRRLIFSMGSALIVFIAFIWLVERSADIQLIDWGLLLQ